MSEAEKIEDIEKATKQLFAICKDSSKFRMTIPVEKDDTDQLFMRVFEQAKQDAKTISELKAQITDIQGVKDQRFRFAQKIGDLTAALEKFVAMTQHAIALKHLGEGSTYGWAQECLRLADNLGIRNPAGYEHAEHRDRLQAMIEDEGDTWDLSEDDKAALKWALDQLKEYRSATNKRSVFDSRV